MLAIWNDEQGFQKLALFWRGHLGKHAPEAFLSTVTDTGNQTRYLTDSGKQDFLFNQACRRKIKEDTRSFCC